MPFGSEGLVVTWVGPVPAQARVNITDRQVFDQVGDLMDRGRPAFLGNEAKRGQAEKKRGQAERYFTNLRHTDVFNASITWDIDTFVKWQEHHGVEMEERPLEIFNQYLEEGNALFMSLVGHPPVARPETFTRCSIVLQRAVIFFRGGREDLFLRSYFHSSNGEDAVNFVPTGTVRMSFATDSLWFPLALTEGIPEPAAEVVLDIASDQPLSQTDLPKPFQIRDVGRVEIGLQRFDVTRIGASIPSAESVPDFRLAVSGREKSY